FRHIVANAGGGGSVIVAKVAGGRNEFGYDAKLGGYKNMISEGIIDPTKVTRVALVNAASVSGLLLSTECEITEIKKEGPAM
ncbi:60 kDa chaperonin GroEL, partial [Candidatus Sulcia muelleri str. Hc (Homalodisca coagulata)]